MPAACPASATSFTDVAAGHFAKVDIECLVALGIINGTSPTTFSPDEQITRAQTAALLARMLRRQGQACFTSADVFADVSGGHFAKVDIECLHALGIINGTSPTAFSPDEQITRAQTAALLARMLRRQGQVCFTGADVFADVSGGHFAKVDIECLSALGIINGTSPTAFSPDRRITRAQTAALLARMWRRAAVAPTETLQDGGDGGDGGGPPGGGPPGGGPPGGGPPGGGPGTQPANSTPGQPGTPTLAAQDQGLGVSWTAPSNGGLAITDYDVQYRVEDVDLNKTGPQPGPWMPHTHAGSGTTATIGSLANGTDYEVQVRAENSLGEGPWSRSANKAPAGVPAVPGAPAVTTGHQRLAVSWTEPADNGATISGYKVRHCDDSTGCDADSEWTTKTLTGTGTSTTITGLTNDTAYQVQVRATNSVGDSDWSGSAESTPEAQPPSAPSTTERTVAQGHEVSWTAPANNGDPITNYEVRYRIENSGGDWPASWTFYAKVDDTTNSITISLPGSNSSATLQAFMETNASGSNVEATRRAFTQANTADIQAQVRAENSHGWGGWSAQPPDAPAALQVAPVGAGLTATWTAPASNGAPITDYDVQYRIKDTDRGQTGDQPGSWNALAGNADPGTNTTATITGLTNGTAYQVRVQATNSAGDSAWSETADGTPAAENPSRPDAPVVAANSQGQSLDVSWTAPASNGGSAITDYDVQYRACTATDKTCATNPTWETNWTDRSGETGTDTATTTTLTGLTNGTAYQVQVRAANSVDESEWSPVSSGTPATGGASNPKPPDAPAAPNVDALNQGLGVSWDAPTINGSAVTGYSVRFRVTDTDDNQSGDQPGSWMYQGHTDTSTSTVIESLTNGVSYQAQVLARSAAGDSAWSSSAAAAPAAQKPDEPVAPTVVVRNRGFWVSWAAPASNGAAVTDFDLRWRACTATDKSCATSPAWGSWTDRGGESTPDTATSATITGLANGTAYQMQVRAANSVDESKWSLSTTGLPAAQRPAAPSAPSVTVWNRSLRISWTAPEDNGADISDYDLQYRACTATDKTCATNPDWGDWTEWNASNTSIGTMDTITGLVNGTAYQVRVRAANSVGESIWSLSSNERIPAVQKPDKPDAPTVGVWNESLRISWDAPADNGAAISDYDVQYRACTAADKTCATNPAWGAWTEWNASDDSTTASATITGLTNGTAYQVQVRATNSEGDSAWSASAKGTPAAQKPDKPDAPTVGVWNESLRISWDAPADNGAAIDDYDVQYRACTAADKTCATNPAWGTWTEWNASDDSTTASATITGLTNGTAYQVQVRAGNGVGDGAWSDSAAGTPAAQKPSAPSAPTLVVWNKSLRVSWTAPNNNGASISDYDVQYRKQNSDNTWPNTWTSHAHTGTAVNTTVTGLTNDSAYQVQVQATNSAGDSAWSTSATATPTAQKPDAPSVPSLSYGDRSLGVEWSAPADNGAAITDYDVRYCVNSTGCDAPGEWTALDDTGDNATDTDTETTIGSLTNGTTHQVQVRAGNSVGNGAWSASASEYPSTVPGTPAAPTLGVANLSLTVSWSAPSGDGGSAVTGYKVGRCSASCGTDSNWTLKTLTTTGTSTTLTGLVNGTAYQVRVAATNRGGDSTWSTSATATPARVPAAPSAPTLTVDNASLGVSWTAPANNGAAISDYDVRYRKQNSDNTWPNSWTAHAHTGTGTSTTITGLDNDSAYQVQVLATNSEGDSAWSASATATPTAQRPAAPAAPSLTYGDESLDVSWSEPADNGEDISGYKVRHCVNSTGCDADSEWTTTTLTGTDTETTIGSLTNGTTYQVQVLATNSVGDGAWSASASEYPSTVPGAPGTPTLTVGDLSLGVSWAAPSSTGGSAVTGYKVGRCSTSCGTDSNWTVKTLTGTDTSTALTGLTNGTAYQVRVAATNRGGDSVWSTSATATPAKAPDAPGAPTLVVWNKSLRVSWTAPASNGASISDYDVQYRKQNSDNTWPNTWTAHSHTGTAVNTTITGLTNDSAYQVQVQATNSAGDSAWSASATATPTAQKPDAPAVPTLTYGDQSLGVEWSAPAANGQAISDYDVRYCTNSTGCDAAGEWTALDDTGNNATDTDTETTIGSLTNGTVYQVQVRAGNSVGDGAWSTSATEYPSTVPGAPGAPTLGVKNEALDVSWSAPASTGGSAITGYKVGRCSANCGTDSNWTVTTLTGTGRSTTLTGLTNGTAYQVRVAATNRGGDSTWSTSATATPARVPDTPAAPTLTKGAQQLGMSWTAPSGNGSSISDYNVQYRIKDTDQNTSGDQPGSWVSHSHTGTATNTTIAGLTNGTTYQVQVQARNSVGTSTWSDSAEAAPEDKPAQPAAPTLTYSDQSLGVEWTAPADNGQAISDYDVRYCTNSTGCDAAGEWTALDDTGDDATDTSTTATIGSLTNGTLYQVQVRAGNSVGDGAWSASASEYPSTTPGAAGTPTLTVGDLSLGVSWAAPSSTGGSAVTGYKVGRCSSGCGTDTNWTVKTLTGTGRSTTLSGLVNGTAYQVRVAATNRSGDSAWSTSATATPAKAPDTPSAPTLVVWNKSLRVSWTAPNNNGAAISDYDVQYRACTATDSDTTVLTCATNPTWGDWTDRSDDTNSDTAASATVTGLTNGTAYQVQVQATNSAGDSAWSASAAATPTAQKPDAPSAPTLSYSDQSLGVEWTAPADNGQAISDYDVRYCTNSTGCDAANEWTALDDTGNNATDTDTETTIGSLTNGTVYQVQVRAGNSVGDGAWSTSASEYPSTTPGAPGAPTLTVGDLSLGVSWAAPSSNGGSAVTGYKVGRCSANCGTDTNWTVTTLTGTDTSTTLTGLTNGTAYQVRVAATNRGGDSAWSTAASATPAKAPDTPAAPTVTVWNKSLRVSWTAPADNGASISDYDVQYRKQNSDNTWPNMWTSHAHTGTAVSTTITGLTNDSAYQVQVQATNSAGDSAWSASAAATPTAQKPDAPSAPSLSYSDRSLGVEWSAPAANGASISDYDVRYCVNSTGCDAANEWTALGDTGDDATDTSRTATIGSLTNGTTYQVQVRAGNSVGDGAWSASASEYPSTVPGAPGTPTLTVGDLSLGVSWAAPSSNGGSAVTGYKVGRCSANCGTDTNWTVKTLTGTGRSTTLTGLTNGTAYQVRVAATNRGGDSAWSTAATATPAKAPDAPSAPTVTVWNKSLRVSWTAPADNGASISDYDVQYRKQNSDNTWPNTWTSHTHTGTGTSTTITGLTNDSAYQVQVQATNSAGDSAWSASATATPTAQKPDAPSAPTLSYSDRSLGVEWSAPAANGQAISDYDVRYCTNSTGCDAAGEWTALDDTGNNATDTSTTASITGLTNGTVYQVRVRAGNSVGDGAWSASASEYPSTTPGVPGAPTLTVRDLSLGVSWSAPSSNGGSAVTGYKVGRCSTSCGTDTNWTVATLTGTSATLGGLTNGTAYQVRVAATNRGGDSAWSTSATATPAKAPDTPSAPTLVVWNKSLRVSWTAPADNGASISDYDVQYRKQNSDNTWPNTWTSHSHTGAATNTTITGLTNDSAYQVQVQATNSAGDSAWSASAAATPTAQKPDAPSAPTLTYSDQSLGVEWTAPADNGQAITDYDVRYCVNSTGCDAANEWTALDDAGNNATDTDTETTIGSLTNGTAYQVQVRAGNSVGDGAWSTSASEYPSTTPGAPGAPTLTVGDLSLGVSWAAPSSNGGSAVTGYKVGRCSANCGTDTNWTVTTLTDTTTLTNRSTTLSDLTNGTAYQVRVAASNRGGDSAWSTTATATPAKAPDTPSAPTLVVWNKSLRVSWTAPASNGASISDYDVQYRKQNSDNTWPNTWTAHSHTGTGTSTTIGSLTNDSAYQVQVQATNSAGDSAWSASATATPTAQKPGAPGAPIVTAKNVSLSVSWDAPADNGATITDYDVQYRACTKAGDLKCAGANPTWGNWSEWNASNTSTTLSATIDSLTNGTKYQVQVRAANSVGDGAWSTAGAATPAPQPPDASAAPTLTKGHLSISVSWTAPAANGAAISDYDVRYRPCIATPKHCNTNKIWGDWTTLTGNADPGTNTSATITQLSANTGYQVQVRAKNSAGTAAWSATAEAVIVPQSPDTPATPTVSYGVKKLDVSWKAPADNGFPISDYDVQYRACNKSGDLTCASSATWEASWTNHTHNGTATNTSITGLTNDTAYQVRVKAQNRQGSSGWSTAAKNIPRAVPGKPTDFTAVPGDSKLTLSWTASGFAEKYRMEQYRKLPTDNYWQHNVFKDFTSSPVEMTGDDIINGWQYRLRIRAENNSGVSAYTDVIIARVADTPPAPTGVTLTVKARQLDVSWTAPTNNSGAPISDYDVQYRACTATDGDSAVLTCATNPTWDDDWTEWNASDDSTTLSASITGLTNGTAYQVQARSVNSTGDGDWSASAKETPAAPPAAPAAPTLTAKHTALEVSWTAPTTTNGAPVSDYDVQYRACTATPLSCAINPTWESSWTEWNASNTSTTLSATITGLTDNTAYQVQVRAANAGGDSAWSASTKGTPVPEVPEAPSAPTFTVWNAEIRLQWTAPDDKGADITDYDVQYRACTATPLSCATNPTWESSWTEWNASNTSTTLSATVTGLTNDTAYQVQVRAGNSVGDGAWSASTKATPTAQLPAVPDAPTLTYGNGSLSVSWTAPANNGAAISDYDVQYRACDKSADLTCATSPTWGSWSEWNANDDSTTIGATITSLTNGTAYQVQVRATNSVGDSTWSSSASQYPSTVPGAPAAPTLTFGSQVLDVSWSAPSSDGGADITGYKVGRCSSSCDNDSSWTVSTLTGTGTTTSLTGLTNGVSYQVRVAATNRAGDSAWSSSATESPAYRPAKPAAPTLTRGNTQITATWSEPADGGADITGYTVNYREEGKAIQAHDHSGTGTTTTITGLTNGKRYAVSILATNKAGNSDWSAWSAWATPATKPAAPGAPTLAYGNASLSVSWTAPANNGDAITDYDVQYRACDKSADLTCASNPTWGSWTDHAHTGTGRTATITGLTNGTAYQARVRATNDPGTGQWSAASAKEHPSTVPGAPATPTLSYSDQSLGVSWSAPSSDGGADITGYKVRHCENSTGCDAASEWTTKTLTGTGRTATISSLTNGTTYQVQVAATNRSGDSDWSSSASEYPSTVPSAPAAPTVTYKHQKLDLSWTAPATNGAAITDYDVQYRACTASPLNCTVNPSWGSWTEWNASDTSTTTSATISSLTNGTAYQMQVRATNRSGDSAWSTSAKEYPSTTPSKPVSVSVKAHHQSLLLTWGWSTDQSGGSGFTGSKFRYRACTATPKSCASNATWGTWQEQVNSFYQSTNVALTGLTNETAYQVQVAFTNRSGHGPWSDTLTGTPTPQKPNAPGEPTLTVKHRSLDVSWSAPTDNGGSAVTDYDVQYRACTATPKTCDGTNPTWGTWRSHSHTGTGLTTTITGLTNGTAYQVQVQATNSLGDSPWSFEATATPAAAPSTPGRPTLNVGPQRLDVSWTAPNNGGSAITDYDVRYCDNSTGCDASSEWTERDDTGQNGADTSLTARISDLTNGTTYRVQVRAGNERGDSAWSSHASGKPADKPSIPDAPTLVSGNLSLSVSWTAPASNGSNITVYKVRYCGGETADCYNDDSTDWKEKSTSSTSTTIGSLVNGTSYRVKVRARNARGDSDWSSETEGTPGAPVAPSTPSLTEGNNQLTASWTAPSNRGDAITAYGVEYCNSTDSTCTSEGDWSDDSPTEVVTSHDITGLTNGTTYKVRVRAQNSRGWSGWSSEATATPATTPGTPDSPTLEVKDGSLGASWTAPTDTGGSAITGYSVRYCDNSTLCDAANEWTVRTVSSGSTTTYTIGSLTNGKTYEVQVAARNRKGLSAWSFSASASPAALPAKPTGLAVEAAHQSLKVSWTASVDNGTTVTGYEVEYRKQNSDNTWPATWTSDDHSGTDTYTTIDSLTNGSKYQVRVQADSSNGKSGWTSAVSGTPKAVPDAPDAPTLTSGDRKIDLSWSPPNNNNGSAVTDYDVRYRKQNSNSTWPTSWTTLSHTGTATTASMTSLTNGSAYQVQVRAQNANGESPWSTASTATPAGKPAKPATPTVTASGGETGQELTVTWTAPSSNGSDITGYSVQYCDSSNDCTEESNWTEDSPSDIPDPLSHAITGLTNGTTYKVQVRATNDVGDGAWSLSATGTPAGKPSAPENLEFVSGGGFLTVSWTTASNGSTISGHQVRYCNTSDSNKDCYNDYDDWTTVSVSGTTTSKKISGLSNGDYYDVEVRANSNQGYSDWSSSSSGTPGAPAKPTISTLTAGDDQFTVTWTAPNSNGDNISFYEVGYCNETNGDCAAGSWFSEHQWDPSTRSLNVTSLEDASKYKVRVRAENGRGAGEWSTISTVTTT